MADEMPRADEVTNLAPEEVAAGLREGRMLLVDVREPNETSVESYPDAVIVPLSCFDPAAIPDPQGKQVVFACRSGRRSITASVAAQDAGYPYSCSPCRRHHWVESGRVAYQNLSIASWGLPCAVDLRLPPWLSALACTTLVWHSLKMSAS